MRGQRRGLGDRLGLVVELGVRRPQLVEGGVHVGGVAAVVGEPVEVPPALLCDLAQPRRDLDVVPGQLHPAQVRVDERVHGADVVGRGGLHRGQVELLPDGEQRNGPVLEEIGVAHERAGRAPGGSFGVQHHVDPRGGPVDLTELGSVVLLLAAHHLGHRPEHRDVRRRGVAPQRRRAPQAQEPGEPRVLDHQLRALAELRLQPLVQALPQWLEGAELARLEPRGRPRVADLHVAALEQLVVEVDHPLRLTEPSRVGVVGLHLRLRHVHAERLQRAGHRAGAAPSGPDHEDHPTLHGRFDGRRGR